MQNAWFRKHLTNGSCYYYYSPTYHSLLCHRCMAFSLSVFRAIEALFSPVTSPFTVTFGFCEAQSLPGMLLSVEAPNLLLFPVSIWPES